MKEEWKELRIATGVHCEVCNDGRVRQLIAPCEGSTFLVRKYLKHVSTPRGLAYVAFYRDGKQLNRFVHRLVAAAFVPNPEELKFIAFADGCCSNVSPENLLWSRRREKSGGWASRLTKNEISEILKREGLGEKQKELAAEFGICTSYVSLLKKRHPQCQ